MWFFSQFKKCSLLQLCLPTISIFFVFTTSACSSSNSSEIIAETHQSLPLPGNDPTEEPIDWYSAIRSKELDFFIQEALEQNFDLSAGAFRVLADKALVIQSRSSRLPEINGNLSANKRKTNFATLGQGNRTAVVENHQLSLDISWEIDLWGKLANLKNAQTKEWEASKSDLAAAQLSITAQVAKAWFNLIATQLQYELAQSTYENVLASTKQIRDLYNAGIKSSLDLRLANANLAEFKTRLPETLTQRNQRARELEILLGRYPANSITPVSNLPKIEGSLPSWAPVTILSQRPDVIAFQNRLLASDQRLQASKKNLLPQIKLTASAGTASTEFNNLLDSDFSVWNLAGNLLQPIFQGKRLTQNVKIQKAKLEEQIALYKKSLLQVFLEIEMTLSDTTLLEQAYKSQRLRADEATAAESLAWERYQKGLIEFTSFLNTERSKFNAENSVIIAKNNIIQNYINLHLALAQPANL